MHRSLQQSIVDITTHFNSLNQDKSHFTNSNDICTPIECVCEMVDSIPSDFWQNKNLKILDPCCGNGNFHAYISTKTDIKNLYFNEINPARIKNVYNYFGNDINLSDIDFLQFKNNVLFDLIVANPPYAKFTNNGLRASKNHNLSRDFIKKALQLTKESGYILFIVPNNWMSFSDRNNLPQLLSNYQFKIIDIHGAKKWFPKVGSSFTWFLLQKIPNQHQVIIKNNYIIKDTSIATIKKSRQFIPLYHAEIVNQILDKTINNHNLPKYQISTSSYLHHYTKKHLLGNTRSDDFTHKIIHTPSQIVWSKIPHKLQNGYKVFLSLTNQYNVFIDCDSGMTQSIAFIFCNNKENATTIASELNHPVYKFLNNITRYGNFNNIRVLQNFPLLASFNLSQEEQDFIKTFNEKYYQNIKKCENKKIETSLL